MRPPAEIFLYFKTMLGNSVGHAYDARLFFGASLSLVLGLGLSACTDTDPQTAGGGPSGTDAGNAITAEIVTAGTSPAAMARVRLMDCESIDGSNSYEASTDKNGVLTIPNVADGDYTLEVVLDGEALQRFVQVSGASVDLGKDRLKKMATVSGHVGDSSANGMVKVRGMEHSAKVEKGEFAMDSLPEGVLSLVYIPDVKDVETRSTYLKVVAGEKSTASTFAEESRALLLDDFQDSNYQNRFMPAHTYDGGWWYFNFDTVTIEPSFIVDTDQHIFVLENEDGNIVAHVGAKFSAATRDSSGITHYPWATMGIELGKSDKALCNDISSVDSIAFRAKGIGAIRFDVIEDLPETESRQLAESIVELGEEWERVSIPLQGDKDDFKCVNQLTWGLLGRVDDYVEFWLDDIELIGGDRLSIWEK